MNVAVRIRASIAILCSILRLSEASGTINRFSVDLPDQKPLEYTGKDDAFLQTADDYALEAKHQFQLVIFVAATNIVVN
jgi:hypothetical protein